MQNQLFLTALILAAVTAGLALGILVTLFWSHCRSRQFRTQHDIPNIIGGWRCQWFDDAVDPDKPKIEDTVEIQKWVSNGEFLARGYQPQFQLSYPMVGDVDPSRVVTLVYKAGRYPYEPNRGVICMQLSRDGTTMEGRWFGRRFSGELGGGKVTFLRMPESAAAA
jgi:hypothetical protein